MVSLNEATRDPALERCLLLIRWSAAFFLAIWALDKIVGPAPAMQTFSKYYLPISDGNVMLMLGVAQLVLVAAFAAGAFRTITYGTVVAMHAVSTFASWFRYIDPWARPNILFWAAIPVLGALIALFVLRHRDHLFSFDAARE